MIKITFLENCLAYVCDDMTLCDQDYVLEKLFFAGDEEFAIEVDEDSSDGASHITLTDGAEMTIYDTDYFVWEYINE